MEKTTNTFQLCMKLRGHVPFYGFSSSMIELLFLKYLYSDEHVMNKDNFDEVSKFRTMISENSFAPQRINAAFSCIEKKYGIDSGILSEITPDLKDLLTGANSKMIFEFIKESTLPKTPEDMAELIENILESDNGKDISNSACFSMNSGLIKLTSAILEVKPSETYMDMFCGFSKSSLRIKAAEYFGNDINPAITAVANMIMILMGRDKFKIHLQDNFGNHEIAKADKVLIDGPLGMRLDSWTSRQMFEKDRTSEMTFLQLATESLNDKGVAVVVVATPFLSKPAFAKKIQDQVRNGNIKAIITLPAMLGYTSLKNALVILEKGNKNEEVMMIDASTKEYYYDKGKNNIALTDNAIQLILDALGGKEIPNFSKKVSGLELLNDESKGAFIPEQHFEKAEIKYRSVSVVEEDLDLEYKKLINLLNLKKN